MLQLPRNIILVGFMGSGKSVVGTVLSRLTSMTLLDTDDEIVLRAGKSIDQIFQESGEAAFRKLESSLIDDVCSHSGNVIAVGGGAFVDPDNRTLMLASGLVFCLNAQPETIYRRITLDPLAPRSQGDEHHSVPPLEGGTTRGSSSPVRPLLAGNDPMGRIKSLLDQRANAYAQAHHTIETDHSTPEQVAGRILELCSAKTAVNGE